MSFFNERNLLFLKSSLGGVLAGLAFSKAGFVLMPFGIAILWSVSGSLISAFLWGFIAVLLSHIWLLGLHPLMWMGVPALFSLPIAISIWLSCGILGGLLVLAWSFIGNKILSLSKKKKETKESFSYSLLLALIWGLCEAFLPKSPFFWIGIGSTVLPLDRWLAGLSSLFGAGGLASVQILIGWWIWLTVSRYKINLPVKKIIFKGLIALLILHLVGFYLLPSQSIDSKRIPIALWQTSKDTRLMFNNKDKKRQGFTKLIQKTLDQVDSLDVDFLIAPEGTLDVNQVLLSPSPVKFFSGGFRWINGKQRSSLLLFDKGESKASYFLDKHRLVPLGEWTPNIFGLPFSGLSAIGGLEAGNSSRLFEWEGPDFAIAICYEVVDGNSIAKAVSNGAEWILSIANLDPYPILLQKQFLSLAQLRSIENSRNFVVVSNTGPSALISSSGKVKYVIDPFSSGVGVVNLSLNNQITFYSKWQEIPLFGILFISIFRFCFVIRRKSI